jgi:hypothetical protein
MNIEESSEVSTINWRSNALKRLFPLILLATLLLSGCTNVSQFLLPFHSQLEQVKTSLHSQLERAKTLLPAPKTTDKAASNHTPAIADIPSSPSSKTADESMVDPVSESVVEPADPGSEIELSQPIETVPTEDSTTLAPEASEPTSSPASAQDITQDITDDTMVSPDSEPSESMDLLSAVEPLQVAETTLEENLLPVIPESSETAVSSPSSTPDENFQATLSESNSKTSLVAPPEATVGITPVIVPEDAIAPPSEIEEPFPSEVTTESPSKESVDIIATPNSTEMISTSNLPSITAKASETPNQEAVVVEEPSLQPTEITEAEQNPAETVSSSRDSAL